MDCVGLPVGHDKEFDFILRDVIDTLIQPTCLQMNNGLHFGKGPSLRLWAQAVAELKPEF